MSLDVNSTSNSISKLAENLEKIKSEIAKAAVRSGRDQNSVRLVAVSKKIANALVRKAFELGHRDFAENYVQEAMLKMSALSDLEINWHCIGALQTNKVKLIADRFDFVHSVDRDAVAAELAARSQKAQKILIEVNLADEESKHGVSAENLPALIETVQKLGRLQLAGLMFMPPFDLDVKAQHAYFARARDLRDKMKANLSSPHNLADLSMGTSHDYLAAISEGSTMVRIGTAIFGARERE